MSKFKKILIALLSVCMTVCAGAALAACKDKEGEIINPGQQQGEFKGDYEITVKSQGGLLLDDIKLTFEKDGEQKGDQYVTANGGKVSLHLDPDVYDIIVDASDRPGYFVPAGTTYKTASDSKDVNIILNSNVINGSAPADTKYALGDVVYDFSFTDIDGVEHSLSKTLTEKNTVVLNFWGTQCTPCRDEFPALQAAYEAYNTRLELFALSSYSTSLGPDTENDIRNFRDVTQKGKLTFPMALDTTTRIYNYFMGSNRLYPTTVIIDRYGVVAWRLEGSNPNEAVWKAEFNKFTSDSYSQSIKPGEDNEDIERVPPDEGLAMPSNEEIYAAVANTIPADKISFSYDTDLETNPEAALNWPWMLSKDNYLYTSNSKARESWSIMYCDVTLKAGDGFSFEYNIDTKSSNNVLNIFADGTKAAALYGNSEGWVKYDLPLVANRKTTVHISFIYLKDDDVLPEETRVSLRNFQIYDASQKLGTVDLAYSITDEADFDGTNYDVNVYRGQDGIWRYAFDYNGAHRDVMLFADLTGVTNWAEIHHGSKTFDYTVTENGETFEQTNRASMYLISYFKMSNRLAKGLEFDYGHTKTMLKNYYLQSATVNGNGYVPVTDEVKDMLCDFIDYAYEIKFVTDKQYDDQWLEFCYYFRHWGGDHLYVDHDLLADDIAVTYDAAKDVYTVPEIKKDLDNKVYIDFFNDSFGIVNNGMLQYYAISTLINLELFDDLGGVNYRAKMTEYLNAAKANEGDTYGLVAANKELVDILTACVEKYGGALNNSWKVFSCYFNIGNCAESANPYTGLVFDFAYDAALGMNDVKITEILNITVVDEEAGGGIKFKFTPAETGVYCFESSYTEGYVDPAIYIFDSDYKTIAYQNNDPRYDHFERRGYSNFYLYVYLVAGETYYITATVDYVEESTYKMNIEYLNTSYIELLRVATTGDGLWTPNILTDADGNPILDENGEIQFDVNDTYYIAIDTTYDSSAQVYRHIKDDNSLGSVVYIDFIRENYFGLNNSAGELVANPSLYELFTVYNTYDEKEEKYRFFDEATKAKLSKYYEQAISRDKDDELYGMVAADKELVDILKAFFSKEHGDSPDKDTGAWKMFACYYQGYGIPDAD